MSENKVVWVLGAGFSRSLGGPLLHDLFDAHRYERVVNPWWDVGDQNKWNALREKWQKIYNLYRRPYKALGPDETGRPWANPEEYVEMLQLASAEFPSMAAKSAVMKAAGNEWRGWDFSLVSDVATKYLAAMTAEFLVTPATDSERWQPYRRWIAETQKQDSYVSFNYDQVVEMAHEAEERATPSSIQRLRLSKLHGSVDWLIDDQGRVSKGHKVWASVIDDTKRIALGVPGPSKLLHSNQTFKEEWDRALYAIEAADVLVFVGYRFPETDNHAKRQLLAAIGRNKQPNLVVRLVLGPERSKDVNRLEGMIRWALSHRRDGAKPLSQDVLGSHPDAGKLVFRVVHEPMNAEDFLAVFDRSQLHTH